MPAFFDCGFSVREPMWHGEGTVLSDYPEDWDAARLAAGLMWEPKPETVYTLRHISDEQITAMGVALGNDPNAPRFYVVKEASDGGLHDVMVADDRFKAITRDDNGKVLAVPTSGFQAVTHAQMGEVIEAVLESDNNVKFETAGSCKGGAQVWALARLDEPYQIGSDSSPIYPFLSFLNGHDGSAACKLVMTDIRVVCWNTWNAAAAQGERSGAQYVFKHVGDIAQRIEDAKTALKKVREDSLATRKLFEDLAKVPVNEDQVKTFTQLFIASPADHGEFVSDRVAANISKARATFTRLHDESETMTGIQGSAYGLLQAATEYLDHVRAFQTRDSYLGRTLLRPEPLKARALELVHEVTAVAA